jgi:hypothetical protein
MNSPSHVTKFGVSNEPSSHLTVRFILGNGITLISAQLIDILIISAISDWKIFIVSDVFELNPIISSLLLSD